MHHDLFGRKQTAWVIDICSRIVGRLNPCAVVLVMATLIPAQASMGDMRADAPEGPKLGAKAPGFALLDSSGRRRALSDFQGKKRVALVLYPALFRTDEDIRELRSLQAAAPELDSLDIVVLAVSSQSPAYNRDLWPKEGLNLHLLSDPDRSVIKRYIILNEKHHSAERVTFLITRDGVIRRIERKAEPATHGQALVAWIRKWQTGEMVYRAYCIRCHGADGNDTGYPGIKALGGIGNRMGEKEILESTEAAGFVDLTVLSEQDLEALGIYVGGL